jgi:hypothetical protein
MPEPVNTRKDAIQRSVRPQLELRVCGILLANGCFHREKIAAAIAALEIDPAPWIAWMENGLKPATRPLLTTGDSTDRILYFD